MMNDNDPHCGDPEHLDEVYGPCNCHQPPAAAVQPPAVDRAECSASMSGRCLAEAQSETGCATEDGECVHGGHPAADQTACTGECDSTTGAYKHRLGCPDAPPVDQTDLRDRIARPLHDNQHLSANAPHFKEN